MIHVLNGPLHHSCGVSTYISLSTASICKKHNTKLYVVTREHFSFDLFQAWEVNSLYPVSDKVEQGHILSKPALYLLSSAEYK